MGRQLLLHLVGRDEEALVRAVRATGDIRVLPWSSRSKDFPDLKVLPKPETEDFWSALELYNQGLGQPFVTKFVPKGGYFVVDEDRSPVIEWTRSRFEKQKVKPGRIWATFEFTDVATKKPVDKGEEFRKWYDTVEKWIKRNFVRTNPRFYAGPEAVKFREHGGELDWFA